MPTIGYLSPVSTAGGGPPYQWFHAQALMAWAAGPHPAGVALAFNWQDASAGAAPAVANLVAAGVDVIVASTTPTLQAAIAGAAGIPIVGVGIADNSLFGGLVTGVASLTPGQSPALAQILRAVPGVSSFAVVYEAGNASKEAQKDRILRTGPGAVGWPVARPAAGPVNWNDEFHNIGHAGHDGAIVLSSPLTAGQAATLVPAANAFVQRTLFAGDGFAGGLMWYGPERKGVYEKAADMAVQICNGGAVPAWVPATGVQLRVSQAAWAGVFPGLAIPSNLGGKALHKVP